MLDNNALELVEIILVLELVGQLTTILSLYLMAVCVCVSLCVCVCVCVCLCVCGIVGRPFVNVRLCSLCV